MVEGREVLRIPFFRWPPAFGDLPQEAIPTCSTAIAAVMSKRCALPQGEGLCQRRAVYRP